MAKRRRQRPAPGNENQVNKDAFDNVDIPEGGLDADIREDGNGAETTGRMLAVDVSDGNAASMKSVLSSVAKATGLGSTDSAVCRSSDFGDLPVDEDQAATAEVVVLEEIGVALLQGDEQSSGAAAAMMYSDFACQGLMNLHKINCL